MATNEINMYIEQRYQRWLEYSQYHCTQAGIPDEALDVLNEVLLYLLKHDDNDKLMKLYNSKKGQYRELDYFVLRMIKLNASSDTSPYRNKYKPIPANRNIDLRRLNIEDKQEEEIDRSGIILRQVRLVRLVFDGLELTEIERTIFEYRFFDGEPLSMFHHIGNHKTCYQIYRNILNAIHEILYNLKLTPVKPLVKTDTARKRNIVEQFMRNRKIKINHSEN